MTLTCSRCKAEKDEAEFYPRGDGHQPYCKPCSRAVVREWRKRRNQLNPGRMTCPRCGKKKGRARFRKGYHICGRCQRDHRDEPDTPFDLGHHFRRLETTMSEEMAVVQGVRIWLSHEGTPDEPVEALDVDAKRKTSLSALIIATGTAIQTERMDVKDLPRYTEDEREEAA